MTITPEHALEVYAEADCLYSKAMVETAFDRMAKEIKRVLGQSNPLVLTVMQGGVVPAGMLLPRLDFPLQVDYIHATRYRGATQGGELQWIVRPSTPVQGRTLLLIDDIHDEGHTLAAIVHDCEAAGAAKVYSAVMLNKQHDRKNTYRADFVGLDVEDRYVFGFGMDYKGYLRNAPGIYAVKDHHA